MIVGVETGGTKVVCAAARPETPDVPVSLHRFPTSNPRDTIEEVHAFIREAEAIAPVRALGLAAFGPVDADPTSPTFGLITDTPKAGWSNVDLLRDLNRTNLPAAFVSDVTAAAIGEFRFGAGQGRSSIGYVTVGTGVGVGLVLNGAALSGRAWPEAGHLLVRRHADDDYPGLCPFHGDCLEGLASGPAIQARWDADLSSLPQEVRPAALEMIGFYLAQLVSSLALTVGVQRVVLGGGVMLAPGVLTATRAALPLLARNYGPTMLAHDDPDDVLLPPTLEGCSGVIGALSLAADLLQEDPQVSGAEAPHRSITSSRRAGRTSTPPASRKA
jgi:fructokinase